MTGKWRAGIALGALLIGSACTLIFFREKPPTPGEIRVGVDHTPPFYLIQPDGSVRGLAVDVLNEAARRRNIRLTWVPLHDIPLDEALSKRIVQMWPLVGMTPDRQARLFMTKPWLESDYILASLRSRPIHNPEDAVGRRVAHARLRFTTIIAGEYLSASRLLVRPTRAEAIQAVCTGDAAAALVESRVLDAILLARPPGCETVDFHISALHGATSPLSMAAVPEMRATAQALRDEITNLTKDGFLSGKLDEWSPFSAEGTRSVWAEEAADQRSLIYRYCLVLIAMLATVLAWVAWRAWRLKQMAEVAESGRRETQRRFTAFMEHSPAMAYMKDAQGRMLYVNSAWSQTFGLTPWAKVTAGKMGSADADVLTDNRPRQTIESVPLTESESRDLLIVRFPFAGENGERFVGATAIDITESEAAIREVKASEARYRELFDHNPLPAWVYDRATLEFLTVNDAAVQRYGWTREAFTGGMKLPQVIVHEEGRVYDSAALDDAHSRPGSWQHRTEEGLLLSVVVTGYELEYRQRRARLMIIRDVTEQERTLEHLRIGEERWQLALRGAGDALWDWDLVTGKVFRSPRWYTMLGYPESSVGNTRDDFMRLLHPEDVQDTEAAVKAHLNRETAGFSCEYRLQHCDGTWRWILDRGQAVWDERGRAIRMAGSQADVTERHAAEQLLAVQARTDVLTGLPNRREFDRLLSQCFDHSRQSGKVLTVCVCDLDRFKEVNDTYGHATGDRVLTAFAAILQRNLGKSDLAARIGGDEFVLALPGMEAEEARALAERVRKELNATIFLSGQTPYRLGCSFGLARLRPEHLSANDLVAEADRYLYEAKDGGRNRTLAAA